MPNFIWTAAQLLGSWLTGKPANITAQTGRNFIVSAFGFVGTTDPTPNNDNIDTAGIGSFFDSGSRWTNTATHTVWFCVIGTPTAAVWVAAPQALTLKVQAGVLSFVPATVPAASTLSFDSTIFSVGPQTAFPQIADITILNAAIANLKLANMPGTTIKGNNAGSSGPPLDLNPSQVVVLLPTFPPAGVGHGVGIVPDPGPTVHSPAWYLGDDGLWHALPGGGGVTAVTATAPLASSGGSTPDISLSGVVPIAKGGTGLSSWGNNEIVVTDGSGNIAGLPLGSNGQVLQVLAGAIAWGAPSSSPNLGHYGPAAPPATYTTIFDLISTSGIIGVAGFAVTLGGSVNIRWTWTDQFGNVEVTTDSFVSSPFSVKTFQDRWGITAVPPFKEIKIEVETAAGSPGFEMFVSWLG